MSMDKKAATSQESQANQFAAEATDEIAEIMNEIQSLQQSMAQAQAPRAPTAVAVPAPAPAPAPEADSGMLEEFHASPGDASMEETLGAMKEEAGGPSMLEDAIAAEGDAQVMEATQALEAHSEEVESLIEAEMAAEAGRAAAESDVRFDESTEAALDALDHASADLDNLEEEAPASAPSRRPSAPPVYEEEFAAPAPPVRSSRRQPAQKESAMDHSSPGAASDGTLTMTLTGNMTLRLMYEFGGQEVSVKFGDQFLQLTLTDGTEFKIPIGRKALKAA